MAPSGPTSVAGLNASNILEGARKRSRLDQVTDVKASSFSPHPSTSANTTASDPEGVTKLGYKLLNVIYHARDVADEDPATLLVEPFLALPDAEVYPDYYQIIKRPLTFEDIRLKLSERGYTSFEDVKHDCEIICQNAKRYNLRETPFWLKAKALHSIIKDTHAELTFAPPGTKSTELDLPATTQLLLEVQVEGVEPISSAPPSPAKIKKQDVDANGTTADEDTSMEDRGSPEEVKQQSGQRRITIKKKQSSQGSGSAPPVVPPLPPAVESLAVAASSPAHTPGTSTALSTAPSDAPSPAIHGNGQGPPSGPAYSQAGLSSPSQYSQTYPTDASPGPSVAKNNGAEKRRRPFGRGKNLKSQMKQWVNELYELKRADGTTYTSDFFEELPSREDYPDYYKVIEHPISLKEIGANVAARLYKSPYSFFAAVRTMIANAKYYNEENSMIWQDADTIERHVETKMLPPAFELGFTLDPNDTRSSVLPLHMVDAQESSLPGSPGKSVTPPPVQSGSARLKVKLGSRTSLTGSEYLPDGVGQHREATLDTFSSPAPYLPVTPEPQALMGQQLPSQPADTTVVGSTQAPTASSSQFSASGRPVRSATSKPPSSRDLPPPLTATLIPGGSARSPPAGSQTASKHGQVLPVKPDYVPQGSPPGQYVQPQFQRPSVHSQGSYRGPPSLYGTPQRYPPQQQMGRGGALPYPVQPLQSEVVNVGQGGQIRRLSGVPPPSVFGGPTVAQQTAEQETTSSVVELSAIPAFVVTGQGLKKALNVASTSPSSATNRSRQFVLPVGETRSEVKVFFKLRDFGNEEQQEATSQANVGQKEEAGARDDAMDVDGEETAGPPNGHAAAAHPTLNGDVPSKSQERVPLYNPTVSAVLNGRKVAVNWNRGTATISVPLQRGPNLLEIFLIPGPPTAASSLEPGGSQEAHPVPCEGYRLWIVR